MSGPGDRHSGKLCEKEIDDIMILLHLESLSRQTTKSDLLALLTSVGGLEPHRVGRIDLRAGEAVIEVPDDWQSRLVKALDGQLLRDRRVRAWAESPPDSDATGGHFERLTRLLDLESRAEAQEALERGRRLSAADAERAGTSLVDLVIADEETGLGGRYLLQLAKRNHSPLPWTRLDVGSPVVLSPNTAKGATGHRGVVCERAEGSLRIALGEHVGRSGGARDLAAGPRRPTRSPCNGSGRPCNGHAGPAPSVWPNCGTCCWAGGSRSLTASARNPSSRRDSTRPSGRPSSSPCRRATWP